VKLRNPNQFEEITKALLTVCKGGHCGAVLDSPCYLSMRQATKEL
jgi:hypothetical protein